MVTLLRLMTGEEWHLVMEACRLAPPHCAPEAGACGTNLAHFYFPSFVVLVTLVLLNLICAVILENFTERRDKYEEQPAQLNKKHLESFLKAWHQVEPSGTGYIRWSALYRLLRAIPPPLGVGPSAKHREVRAAIIKLRIPTYDDLVVHYREVLHAITRQLGDVQMPEGSYAAQQLEKLARESLPQHQRSAHAMLHEVLAALVLQRMWRQRRFRRIVLAAAKMHRRGCDNIIDLHDDESFNLVKQDDRERRSSGAFLEDIDASSAYALLAPAVDHSRDETPVRTSVPALFQAWQDKKLPGIQQAELRSVAPLGRGTFGTVELVWHEETQMPFCLKRMEKLRVVALDQTQNAISELELLRVLEHPFIPRLNACFDEPDSVSLLLEVALGGELTSVIARGTGHGAVGISNESARFYCANILSALAYLHRQKIIHRDVKPENVVLDHTGYLKLVDYGYAKQLRTSASRTWTLCGTPQYMAPELITCVGHGLATDWWSLGILTYEMLTGSVPFDGKDVMRVYKRVLNSKVSYPTRVKAAAKDFIRKLLVADPSKRLGSKRSSTSVQVASHPFLKTMSMDAIEKRQLLPPQKPKLSGPEDASNFTVLADMPFEEDRTNEQWAVAHDRGGAARADYEALAEAYGDRQRFASVRGHVSLVRIPSTAPLVRNCTKASFKGARRSKAS